MKYHGLTEVCDLSWADGSLWPIMDWWKYVTYHGLMEVCDLSWADGSLWPIMGWWKSDLTGWWKYVTYHGLMEVWPIMGWRKSDLSWADGSLTYHGLMEVCDLSWADGSLTYHGLMEVCDLSWADGHWIDHGHPKMSTCFQVYKTHFFRPRPHLKSIYINIFKVKICHENYKHYAKTSTVSQVCKNIDIFGRLFTDVHKMAKSNYYIWWCITSQYIWVTCWL